MRVPVTEAKGQLTELVRRAEAGEEVILTRHGHAAVRLVPVRPERDAQPGLPLRRRRPARMIAVDTSALLAILLGEPEAEACSEALQAEDELLISAGTVAEALLVAGRRKVGEPMARLIDGLGFEIVAVTPAAAGVI